MRWKYEYSYDTYLAIGVEESLELNDAVIKCVHKKKTEKDLVKFWIAIMKY